MTDTLDDRPARETPASSAVWDGPLMNSEEPLPVGSKLKRLQDRLLLLGAKLKQETDQEASELIAKALGALQSQRLSVSVVGQVNAGKTSLVNALAREPGLLPVAQQPWTAVVTRLHFGLHGFPKHSSHFQFFDESEWQRLAEHGGRLRELAERFLPGFNSAQLQQQVEVMKHRAQTRLGSKFKKLLGTAHSFPTLSPEVVARYVSSSESVEPPASEARPNYADITRSADLFFELKPFGYPLTLIDTPGTNDPFLVREETTLRCIDASDACVVVLDATRGVTDSDLGLFRVLKGVNTQRLIMFVNKIDQLVGTPERVRAVTEEISASVSSELGSADIPVIFGCANRAVEGSDQDTAEGDIESGLDELEDALSDLVHHGNSAHYVHQAAATLTALADGVRSQAAVEISQLNNEVEFEKASFDSEVRRARAMAFLEDLSEQISRTTGDAIESLKHISVAYEKQAIDNLQTLVKDFAATKKKEFLEKYPSKLPSRTIRFDTKELRRQLMATHTQDYRRVRRELTNSLRVVAARLMFLMNKVQSDARVNLDVEAVSQDFVYPSQAPLGEALAIDLDEPFWRRWWRRRVTPEEAAASLEALILQEFLPIVPELVRLGKRELETEIDYSALQLSISGTNLMQSLKNEQLTIVDAREIEMLASADVELAKREELEVPGKRPAKVPLAPHDAKFRFDIAKSRHHRADKLVQDLSKLTDECQSLLA